MAVSRPPRRASPQPRLPQTPTENAGHHQQLRPPGRAARPRDTPASPNPRRALRLSPSPNRKMGTRRRRRIRRLRRATHDSTLTAGSTLKLIAVIVPLGPDTLALALGIATESERGVDVGLDCYSSSQAGASEVAQRTLASPRQAGVARSSAAAARLETSDVRRTRQS